MPTRFQDEFHPEAVHRQSMKKQSSLKTHRDATLPLGGDGNEETNSLFEIVEPGVRLMYSANVGDLDTIRELLASGTSVNFVDIDGRTALHVAACQGRTDIVQRLLDSGADVDREDRWGSTLLTDAVFYKNRDVTVNSVPGSPLCHVHGESPVFSDCWYNCTLEDISGEDKQQRLRKALGQTVDWFGRALAVEPVRGNLRLSGYSACGQDGGVQLSREYVEEGVANADLVLLVTTRTTTGNTLAWAVASERDQWGRAIAGQASTTNTFLPSWVPLS